MKRFRFFWWMIAGPIAVIAAVLALAHPYLAITDKSGGDVLVVEGWMEKEQLQQAALLFKQGGYRKLYTTGSVRDVVYYLRQNEGVRFVLKEPAQGEVVLDASGVNGSGVLLVADADTLLRRVITGTPTEYRAALSRSIDTLSVISFNAQAVPTDADNIFVRSLRIDKRNADLDLISTDFLRLDGSTDPAWPTWAHKAAAVLGDMGVPQELITAVPSWGEPDSRSWANASAFGVRAQEDHITAFDVVTLGVHARRSRDLFREGCAPGTRVGVISIPDPLCSARGWWKSVIGWYRMLKEIGGSPEAYAVGLTH